MTGRPQTTKEVRKKKKKEEHLLDKTDKLKLSSAFKNAYFTWLIAKSMKKNRKQKTRNCFDKKLHVQGPEAGPHTF